MRVSVIVLMLLAATVSFASDLLFDPAKVVVTGLIYGPGAPWKSAIVDDKILVEGKTYLVENGAIGPELEGKRVLEKLSESEVFSVAAINSGGVTINYMGKTTTHQLKQR